MALVRTRHNRWVTTPRWTWATAGVVAGFAGLATSYAVAMVAGARSAPVVAVADLVIRHTPGPAVEQALKNRVLMGSMHTGLEDHARDFPKLAAYFRERAEGGVGLIVTGGISPRAGNSKRAITPRG